MAGLSGGAPDTLFPQPDSPAGRLLGHLVGLQVPGTPIELTLPGLASATRLSADVAASALSRLAADGLVQLEPEPESEHVSITVMLAPPLEDYGITAHWGEAEPGAEPQDRPDVDPGAEMTNPEPPARPARRRVTAPGATLRPAPEPARRAQPGQGSARGATQSEPGNIVRAPIPATETGRGQERSAVPLLAPSPILAGPSETPPAAETRPRRPRKEPAVAVTVAAPERPAIPSSSPPAPAGAAAAASEGEASTSETGARRSAADETAFARGFVERFERLLAECEDWRRRCLGAEERLTAAERLLRAAERRAETAETRLASAQERLKSWSELTQRMQQLSRQADTAGRTRPARPRPERAEDKGT